MSIGRALASYFLYLFAPAALAVPRRHHRRLAGALAGAFVRGLPGLAGTVEANLRTATGLSGRGLEALVRRLFANYGLYLSDYMTLPWRRHADVMALFGEVRNGENLFSARERGRGVVLVTPHLGNWELGGFVLKDVDCPVHVLSIRDPFPHFERFREMFRAKEGMRVIYVGPRSDAGGMLEIQAALERNEAVAMLGDLLVVGRAYEARFFGRKVRFPAGPLHIASLTGAVVLPFAVVREGERYVLEMRPPIEVPEAGSVDRAGQRLASEFEGLVRRYPDQWYNFRPVFGGSEVAR